MINMFGTQNEYLLKSILGRDKSFLTEDMDVAREELIQLIRNSRIMVIGAAGSIGSAFVEVLLRYAPAALHLIDISENNLVEVVRSVRSSRLQPPGDFRTYSIDYTSPGFAALLTSQDYDYILNFSALKHVRSERDPLTLMRMLEVNVLGNDRILKLLSNSYHPTRVFSVSSDKAVRPASLMGASKAFMERVFLSYAESLPFSSARFANVLFSEGSLPQGFLKRISQGQPLSAPTDVKRYFISHEEAGQLCLLGCFLGNNREIFYPRFNPEKDMMTFSEIACTVLDAYGLEPAFCDTEEDALAMAEQLNPDSKKWPCYFTPSNTSGEKGFEEFFDPAESTDESRYKCVGVVTEPIYNGRQPLDEAIGKIEKHLQSGSWEKADLIEAVQVAVPELKHIERSANLDQKM